jgi:hypothetical protein
MRVSRPVFKYSKAVIARVKAVQTVKEWRGYRVESFYPPTDDSTITGKIIVNAEGVCTHYISGEENIIRPI